MRRSKQILAADIALKFVPEIREAQKVFEHVQSDPEARELHRVREKAIRDQVNAINFALEQG